MNVFGSVGGVGGWGVGGCSKCMFLFLTCDVHSIWGN